MRRTITGTLAAALGLTGCYTGLSHGGGDDANSGGSQGSLDAGDAADAADAASEGDSSGGEVPPPEDPDQVGFSGLRRLTANEYDNTVRDLLFGDDAQAELLLPNDPLTPFDNAYTAQIASQALIEGADLLAADAAERLAEDPTRRDMVIGCVPASPGDETCMRDFVARFGRLALRRPLSDTEIEEFVHGENGTDGVLDYAIQDGDFYTGVDSFIRIILQDPQFLYRVEIGEPVVDEPGVFKLDHFEIATRLSYFIWGSTPDDALLDLAEQGGLGTPEEIRAAASTMLTDDRAIDRIDRFHALWLGYAQMPFAGELADAMREESRALLERVVFTEQRPWYDVFRLDETYVNDALAEHYGLPLPGSDEPQWVPYDLPQRRGLLAHGSFLSVGGKFNDTSPVQRGLLIRTRLFCQDIPPPPPDVDVDQAPTGAICKEDRYAMHREGGCAGCHGQMDPVGFGLENFDAQGRYRTNELDNPDTPDDESQCVISGQGDLLGTGTFSGPAELSAIAIEAGLLDRCVVTQLYRYAAGRPVLDELDHAFIDQVVTSVGEGEYRFDDVIVDFVGTHAFGYRREEVAQ
jgi:hypothetical protein